MQLKKEGKPNKRWRKKKNAHEPKWITRCSKHIRQWQWDENTLNPLLPKAIALLLCFTQQFYVFPLKHQVEQMFSPNRKYKTEQEHRALKTKESTNDGSGSGSINEQKKNFCTNDRLFYIERCECECVYLYAANAYYIIWFCRKSKRLGLPRKMSPPKKWAKRCVCCFSFEYCGEFPLFVVVGFSFIGCLFCWERYWQTAGGYMHHTNAGVFWSTSCP